MYVSVRRYEMHPFAVDELMRRVEEGFAPIISEAPGFVAYYNGGGVGTGEFGLACVNPPSGPRTSKTSSYQVAELILFTTTKPAAAVGFRP